VATEGGDEAPSLVAGGAPTVGGASVAAVSRAPAPASTPIRAQASAPVPARAPAAQLAPRPARKTQPPARTGTLSVSNESRGRPLRLPQPSTGVSAGDRGLRKRGTAD
jgi:hypothetical protein